MNITRVLLVLVVIALLLAACGENDQTPPPPAEVPAPVETTTAEATGPADTTTVPATEAITPDDTAPTIADDETAVVDETEPAGTTEPETPEQPDTTVAEPAPEPSEPGCPEGQHSHDGGECHPDETLEPAEDTGGTETTAGDMTTRETCEAAAGVWDAEASTCDPADIETPTTETTEPADTTATTENSEAGTDNGQAAEPVGVPVNLVVYEGITSEERCLVAGGDWNGNQCIGTVYADPEEAMEHLPFWGPTLMEDAYQSVDPETVDADHSESFDTRGPWGVHNYHVFYHYNDLGDPQVQYEAMREAARYGVRSVFVPLTDWVWFPHRYDVSWSDVPNMVAVTGTYPLGEQRTLLLHADPEQRTGQPNIELPLPVPPPIRPTGSFTAPQWTELAEELGRDCAPVEEVWDGYGAEVTDPCTLKAVKAAVDWMWRGDATYRQKAIRDGHAMFEWLRSIDELEDPYLLAVVGYEGRVNSVTHIRRDVYWAGHFPGASMIHVEWNLVYADRPFTPEEQAAKVRYYRNLADLGINVRPQYLGDEQTLREIGWHWNKALVVRTADGTWRVSYRAVCYWYESVNLDYREDGRLLCPDDPTPHFPDSAFFDASLYPPSHKLYYQDNRDAGGSGIHQDKVSHRRSGEYQGVPPS